MRLPDPTLLAITDRRQARMPLADIVEAACAAGCRWFSLREKDLPPDEQVSLASSLLAIVRRSGARLMLHGEPKLAQLAGLDGVHLAAGGDPAEARTLLGPGRLIGISVHTPPEAAKVDAASADYAVAGPAYETASKPGYGPALGPQGIAAIVAAARVPILAIGGVTSEVVRPLLESGAAGVAAMGSIMRAGAPGREIAALINALAARRP